MTKKNNKGSGVLFSPELREVTKRRKDKDPELKNILNRVIPDSSIPANTDEEEATEALTAKVAKIVDERLRVIFGDLIGTEARRSGGEPMRKTAITIPAPLFRELTRLPGSLSSNLCKAAEFYLRTKKFYHD